MGESSALAWPGAPDPQGQVSIAVGFLHDGPNGIADSSPGLLGP